MLVRVLAVVVAGTAAACSANPVRSAHAFTPPPASTSASSDARPTACNGHELEVTAERIRRGPNNTAAVQIDVRNLAPAACAISATPSVRFDNRNDLVNSVATADPPFQLGPLAAHATGTFMIGWTTPPQCQPNHVAPIDAITVAIMDVRHRLMAHTQGFGSYCWVDEITVSA